MRRLFRAQCRTFMLRTKLIAHRGAREVVRLSSFAEDVHLLDFLLQLHQSPDQRLRTRRTSGDIDIDRNQTIDALRHCVRVVRTAACRARSHRDHPLRFRHLIPKPANDRRHLFGHRAGDDHQIRLSRRRAKNFRPEARHVVTRIEHRHHLDRAAGQAELHRPKRRLASPIENFVDRGCEDVGIEAILDQTHVRTFRFQA